MTKQIILAWLQARADAHRKRWRDYMARAALYSSYGTTETDRHDERIALAMADQHIFMCAALEQAVRDLEANAYADAIEPIAPPTPGSLAEVLKEGGQ